MLPRLSLLLTQTVIPGAVYATLKSMLKTRDLLTCWSVYPDATSSNATVGLENRDLWGVFLLFWIKEGYTLVGDYLDLNHSHVHTPKNSWSSRNQVL
jgi:hypothetical protein